MHTKIHTFGAHIQSIGLSNPQKKYVIVIAGPTAVGKTKVALEVAKYFHAEIINADSRQIYNELDIGVAKPNSKELGETKHYFISSETIFDPITAGIYEEKALDFINNIFKEKSHVILSGGTGLYIKAVLEGLDIFPKVRESIAIKWENIYQSKGISFLQESLKRVDPEYFAKVDLENHRRIIRAITVSESSGKSYSSFLGKNKDFRSFIPIKILLEEKRELLYQKINARVDLMLEKGLEKEVRHLEQYKNFKALQTVGYQEIFQYLEGLISLEEAIRLIKRNSRRYAKRQMTWFRNDPDWLTFHPSKVEDIISTIEKITSTK